MPDTLAPPCGKFLYRPIRFLLACGQFPKYRPDRLGGGGGCCLRCFHADLLLAHNITLFAEAGKYACVVCGVYPGIVVIKKGRPAGILKRMLARAARC